MPGRLNCTVQPYNRYDGIELSRAVWNMDTPFAKL